SIPSRSRLLKASTPSRIRSRVSGAVLLASPTCQVSRFDAISTRVACDHFDSRRDALNRCPEAQIPPFQGWRKRLNVARMDDAAASGFAVARRAGDAVVAIGPWTRQEARKLLP